jgi:CRISPR-associated protein Cas5d
MKPIKFTNIRRNELSSKLSATTVKKAMKDGKTPVINFIEEDRQQRASLILTDVSYIIDAHFDFTSKEDNNAGKHMDIFNRRVSSGQCFNTPYMGCREFSCSFDHPEPTDASVIKGESDLGWMLHDMDYKNNMEPMFFRAVMIDGTITVPPLHSSKVMS